MACANLGTANDFNVFVFGNHTQSFVDSEGRVAVGGTATYRSYGVGSRLPVSTTRADLIIGGNVDISQGTNFAGNTVISPTSMVIQYTMTNNNGVPNQPLIGTPIDFAAAEMFLMTASAQWAALPPNGTVSNNFGQIVLTGTSPTLNIFTFHGNNVDGSGLRLDSANGINIVAPEGSTILINVGGDEVGFGSYSIFRNGVVMDRVAGPFILWNFYQASTAFNQNLTIEGSVLAPYANWEARGFGNINGTMVAQSLTNTTGSIEEHNVPFIGCLPALPEVPTTSTTTALPTTTTTTTTTTTVPPTTTTTVLPTTTTTTVLPTTTTTTLLPTTTTTLLPTTTTTTGPSFSITGTKTADVATAPVGSKVTFTITIFNGGVAPADVVVLDLLPSNVAFIPNSVTINGNSVPCINIEQGILLSPVNPGQGIALGFKALILGMPPGGVILNEGNLVVAPPGTFLPDCHPHIPQLTPPFGFPAAPGMELPVFSVLSPEFSPTPSHPNQSGAVVLPDGTLVFASPVTFPGITIPPLPGTILAAQGGIPIPITTPNPVTVTGGTVRPFPNLVLKKFVDRCAQSTGSRLAYTILIFNDGNAPALSVKLTDVIPKGLKFIPGTIQVDPFVRLNENPVDGIQIGSIPSGTGVAIRFLVLATKPGRFSNRAEAKAMFELADGSRTTKNFESNPVIIRIAALQPLPLVFLTKSASVRAVSLGEHFQYTLVLTNRSSRFRMENTVLFDPLDESLQYVTGSLRINGVPAPDPVVGVELGEIGPGESRTVTFEVSTAYPPFGSLIINRAAALFAYQSETSCRRSAVISDPITVRFIEQHEE